MISPYEFFCSHACMRSAELHRSGIPRTMEPDFGVAVLRSTRLQAHPTFRRTDNGSAGARGRRMIPKQNMVVPTNRRRLHAENFFGGQNAILVDGRGLLFASFASASSVSACISAFLHVQTQGVPFFGRRIVRLVRALALLRNAHLLARSQPSPRVRLSRRSTSLPTRTRPWTET